MKKTLSCVSGFVLAVLTSIVSVGLSSWVVKSESSKQYGKEPDPNAQKVAYIKDGETKTYYTTLEKALSVANDNSSAKPTVFVIPGVKYTLINDLNDSDEKIKEIEINSGVTLALPFQDELVFEVWKTGTVRNSEGKDVTDGVYKPDGDEYAKSTEALLDPDTYRQTQITIGRNVKIKNNGTINIGGVTGSCSGSYINAGQTCYKFCELVLEGLDAINGEESYQLINNGTIQNQGRIIGKDESVLGIQNSSGSTFKSNFVVKENKGGSALVGMGGGGAAAFADLLSFSVSPFNRVYMPNTMVKMKTDYGATVVGNANMYGDGKNNVCPITIVSTSDKALFQLFTGSYLISSVSLKSLKNKSGKTIIEKYEKMRLEFYGSVSMHYMSMTLSVPVFGDRSIRTNTVLFPISYYEEIYLNSIGGQLATFNSGQNLKILPGGFLSVGENVTLKVDKMAIYDVFNDNIGWGTQAYPKDLKAGVFCVSGNFEGGTIGGEIQTSGEKSSLKITSNSIQSKEMKGTFGMSVSDDNYDSYTFFAHGQVSYNGFNPSDKRLITNQTYQGERVNSLDCWSATIVPSITLRDTNKNESITLNNGGTVTIKIDEMLPDESLFDVSTFEWKVSGRSPIKEPDEQSRTYENGTKGDFVFKVTGVPALHSTTWTYSVTLSGKDINGGDFTSNTYTIKVKK